MRTLLTIERRTRSGRLIERRSQYVRSFTQNLMELLYLAHAQITFAAKRDVTDIRGGVVWSDIERYSSSYGRNQRANLLVAAPGGNAQVWVGGEASSGVTNAPPPQTLLPGELIGIQIGSSDAAVTPQDFQMASRIPHGRRTAVVSAVSQESVLIGDSGYDSMDNSGWKGFFWIPTRQITVTSIKLLMYRNGTPGTLNFHFKPCHMKNGTGSPPEVYTWNILATATTNGDTLPTGSTYEWREFVLSTPVTVVPGMGYVFWGTKTGSGSAYRRLNTSGSSAYANPRVLDTYGGTYWYDKSPLYDIWGTAPQEIEYGACEVSGLSVSNPTAEFIIRRLFTNNSGADVTVSECGIYAGCSWRPEYGSSFPLCICRDVIAPGITLADGEVLAVMYTPRVTV